jgi:hypothetical protein
MGNPKKVIRPSFDPVPSISIVAEIEIPITGLKKVF